MWRGHVIHGILLLTVFISTKSDKVTLKNQLFLIFLSIFTAAGEQHVWWSTFKWFKLVWYQITFALNSCTYSTSWNPDSTLIKMFVFYYTSYGIGQLLDVVEGRPSQTQCPRMHARLCHVTWEPPPIPHPALWWTAKALTPAPRELYETPKQDEVLVITVFASLWMLLSYPLHAHQPLRKYLKVTSWSSHDYKN